jgi:succinyl-diaminopimelate desuccinylase
MADLSMSNPHSPTLELTCELIRRPSVTPNDEGCQALLAERLRALGFSIEPMRFGVVDNLWARRGTEGPLVVFAGHTDVVPTGDLAAWHSPPFEPTIRDGRLYGRGAADMKGSLAAMLTATERLLARRPDLPGSLGWLITADEEGDAVDGTVRVMQVLTERGEHIDCCIVGEPSSTARVGDVVRNGRRGSLNARLRVRGIQGHVAYPETVRNPIHEALPALHALASRRWDEGNRFFPPTSFQISNLNAGTGATNVVPGYADVLFNFRFSTESTAAGLQAEVEAVLDGHGLDYELQWTLSGEPFLTGEGTLLATTAAVLAQVQGGPPTFSTSGGTSDGRFIAPHGAQLIELGPCNGTIHKIDEHVRVEELDELSAVYEALLERLLDPAAA